MYTPGIFEYSVGPDEMDHNEPFQFAILFLFVDWYSVYNNGHDMPKLKDVRVHLRNSGKKELTLVVMGQSCFNEI